MISFFWPKKHGGYLSTRIRGHEIAQFLDVKLNPGKRTDVCIHIKPSNLNGIEDGDYADVLDGGKFIKKLMKRPKINLIACSRTSQEFLKQRVPNKVIFIPHQHINWERQKRERKKVNTCGYIGSTPSVYKMYERIAKNLKKIGFDFKTLFRIKKREDAVNLYKSIDILVIGGWEVGDPNIHKIPTKIINAASFGIPSVAYPLRGYKEIEGFYLRANNMKELLAGVKKIKAEYNQWQDKLIKMAEPYNIKNVVKLYKKLR